VTQAAAKTGVGPTVMVAIEQHFPVEQRIIEDDLARRILPFGMRSYVWLMRFDALRDWMVRLTERSLPGIWSAMMCRKRYIDERLTGAASHIDGVMNLGAGFDTRVYRLRALADIPAWEVDQPENIEPKRARLRRLFGEVPAHVELVPTDFDREDLQAVLASHGYRLGERTFFIWEAVTQYLTETAIMTTLDFLARAAPGSRLAFTYVRKDFLDGRVMYGGESLYEKYVVRDRVWLFGLAPEEVKSLLGAHGWRVAEHLGYEVLAERYVKPTGRRLASSPIERMVYAEKV
jgi:methyltransferase (TIGR00027 family)